MSLTVASGFKTYQWSNGETNNSTIINTAGDHTISVTDSNDCQKQKHSK